MMRSIESASSVFYHSQDEDPGKAVVDSQGSDKETSSGVLHDSYQDSLADNSSLATEHDPSGKRLVCSASLIHF